MKKLYSEQEEIFPDLTRDKPSLIFITGKTCAGKTFLSNKLSTRGYRIIRLDDIVFKSVMTTFKICDSYAAFATYRGNVPQEWIDAFVVAARATIIRAHDTGPVVVEGALANKAIIKAIFREELKDFLFIFLRPIDIRSYTARITDRFKTEMVSGETGLPKEFFQMVDENEIQNYLQTKQLVSTLQEKIRKFAEWSLRVSEERLAYFHSEFKDLTVIEV